MKSLLVLLFLASSTKLATSETLQSCDSPIYCQGQLLHTIQMAKIFPDSKTFVDLSLVNPVDETLQTFNNLMQNTSNNPTEEDLENFVNNNFESEGEIEEWTPSDYQSNPPFLDTITDEEIRDFARNLVSIWPKLARKVKTDVTENPDKHSLISVPNGFIIPGGRFKELYYWDSYWIVEGLLLSGMNETVEGMLVNLMSLVERYGFIPNGSRVYYLNRSQPPLLTLMVARYMEVTNNTKWLEKHVKTIDAELNFWLTNRTAEVTKNGVKYKLAHYASISGTPRPESYSEDVNTCETFKKKDDKEKCFQELKSGAESGWDFSSRWIFGTNSTANSSLSDIKTTRIIPVDLNAFLCKAFKELSNFYTLLGNEEKAIVWLEQATLWEKSIEQVLYNEEDGIWYDFDLEDSKPRKIFFPSNFAPLWTECYNKNNSPTIGKRAAEYFNSSDIWQYQGGIPTSVANTGEQWDLPNAWPPLQEIVIMGLQKTGEENARVIAKEFAKRWVQANIRGYKETQAMFEKYDAINPGQYGGGGEYEVQSGFGWTNGAVLSLINNFYSSNSK